MFILTAVCAFFCAAGCSNLLNKTNDTASGTRPVTVSVAVSVGAARAAYPSTLAGLTELQATAVSDTYDAQTVTASVTGGTAENLSFSLMPGSWVFTVNGIADSTVVVTGSTTATVSANAAGSVLVVLSTKTQTAVTTGNLALSFCDAGSLGFTQVTAALYSDGTDMKGTSSAATIDGKSCYTYSLSGYPADAYTVVFAFLNNGTTVGCYIDRVVIEPGLTTDTWYVTTSGGTTPYTYMSMTSDNILLSKAAASTVYVSGTGSVLASGSDDTGTGTFAKPYASLSKAFSSYYTGATSDNPYKIVIDGTVSLSEDIPVTLTENTYVKITPLANSSAGAVISGHDIGFTSDVTDSDDSVTAYQAEITFNNISFSDYETAAFSGEGSKMVLTVRNCTFKPSSTASCSIIPIVKSFILDGTNTFNNSPIELLSLTNCSTAGDSSSSFITLGADFAAAAGSIPVYVSDVSGSNTQKIIVKSDGTAKLTAAELAYFSVTPSADYYLSLSSDSLYAYLVGKSAAEITTTLDAPLSTVYAVPYTSSFSSETVAGYITNGAVTVSAGSEIYAAAVQISGTAYSVLTGASSYSMVLYDTSGTSLSDEYSALTMDASSHSITLPSWMPAGTYYLYISAKYDGFWYTKTYKLMVE